MLTATHKATEAAQSLAIADMRAKVIAKVEDAPQDVLQVLESASMMTPAKDHGLYTATREKLEELAFCGCDETRREIIEAITQDPIQGNYYTVKAKK